MFGGIRPNQYDAIKHNPRFGLEGEDSCLTLDKAQEFVGSLITTREGYQILQGSVLNTINTFPVPSQEELDVLDGAVVHMGYIIEGGSESQITISIRSKWAP